MNRLTFALVFAIAALAPTDGHAAVRVVTTIPDFADLVRQVGGERVSVDALGRGTQDPHFVDARPSYIVLLNRADLLVYVGAELESGYLPGLVQGARNPKILEGALGHLNASALVDLLEVPKGGVDRAQGDLHPSGNPHFWVNPHNGLRVAQEIARRLAQIDSAGSETYAENLRAFASRLREKTEAWEKRLAQYRGTKVVVYHQSWTYLSQWLGLDQVGAVEPKIGIPPSASSVATLLARAKDSGVRLVLSESYYPSRTAELVAKQLGARYVQLPSMVGARPEIRTYLDLFDAIATDLERALAGA